MNKKSGKSVLYSRVLSTKGDSIVVYPRAHPYLLSEYLERVYTLEQINMNPDLRAMAASLEWERTGDFERLISSEQEYLGYYRNALIACLDGTEYDHGDCELPARWLMLRFVWLYETIIKLCHSSELLDKLIINDPLIEKCYREFSLDR